MSRAWMVRGRRGASAVAIGAATAAGVVTLLCLSGCASKGSESAAGAAPANSALTKPKPSAKTPASALAKHNAAGAAATREELNSAATDLQSMFSNLGQTPGGQPASGTTDASDTGSEPESRPTSEPTRGNRSNRPAPAPTPDATSSSSSSTNAPKPAATLTPAQRRADAVKELAEQLKPDIAAARAPIAAAVPLIGLESISPGSGSAGLEQIARAVEPEQARALAGVRSLVRTLQDDPSVVAGSPAGLARVLRDYADRMDPPTPTTGAEGLALRTVALCARVDGFGRYQRLPSATFVAGRPIAAVLYTEIENFTQRPADAGKDTQPGFAVELGQELTLYLDSDGSVQWRGSEAAVREVAQGKRRDFYLVRRLELPSSLSVGSYTLKVIVRDRLSGAESEQNLPISIVADASATRRR